jgi:hypothetical protein
MYRLRRLAVVIFILMVAATGVAGSQLAAPPKSIASQSQAVQTARRELADLAVKGRAPKTGYSREQFGGDWETVHGCDSRERILLRDLSGTRVNDKCQVLSGTLEDPYTGETIDFRRGPGTSLAVQIDHVVAVSNAWQTGAQQWPFERRVAFYNDPLNLLAVDGPANEQKSDGDAATWLPPNKAFRCQYVSRQVKVKTKYHLWVTPPEKQAIAGLLARC